MWFDIISNDFLLDIFKYKSDLYTRDHEGLGPLDIAMKDRALQTGITPAGMLTVDKLQVNIFKKRPQNFQASN